MKWNCYTSAFCRLIRNDDCYVRFVDISAERHVAFSRCDDFNHMATVSDKI